MEFTCGTRSGERKKLPSQNIPVAVYRIIDVSHILSNAYSKTSNIKKSHKRAKLEKNVESRLIVQNAPTEVPEESCIEENTNLNRIKTASIKKALDSYASNRAQFLKKSVVYVCEICEKSFKHSSHLKRHINTHTGEKSYVCDVCKKTFLDASTLSRHKKIHSGNKPWSCKICKKNFGTLGSLRRHMTLHNQAGRPYLCPTCNKRFPDNSSFQKHVFIHTGIKPHVCDICSKAFVHIGDLNGHRKIHIGIKPYKCDRCGREFAKQSNYSRHLMIHEGTKEYTCNICGVGYNFQSSLTRHLLTHVRKVCPKRNKKNCQGLDSNTEDKGRDILNEHDTVKKKCKLKTV